MKCYGQLTESQTHKVCSYCGTVKDAEDCAGCPREYGVYLFRIMGGLALLAGLALSVITMWPDLIEVLL